MKEAKRLLPLENREPSLPVTQGLIMLYYYEANFGNLALTMNYISQHYEEYKRLNLAEMSRAREPAAAGTREDRITQALSWIHWGFYIQECYLGIKRPQPIKLLETLNIS